MKEKLLRLLDFIKQPNHVLGELAVLLIITAIALITFAYYNVKEASIQEVKFHLSGSAKLSAEGIELLFEKYGDELGFLTSLPPIIDLNERGKEMMRSFYLKNRGTITGITRITKEGRIAYTYPYDPLVIGKDVSSQTHNAYVLKEHKPLISNMFESLQGYKTVAFAYPVFGKDGVFEGCLSLLIPITSISERYLAGLTSVVNLQVELINKNGQELYCNNKEHIAKSFFFQEVKGSSKQVKENVIPRKLGFSNIMKEKKKGELEEYLVYTVNINLKYADWIVMVSLPRKSAYSNVRNLTVYFYFIIGLILIGGVVFFFAALKSRNEKIRLIEERDSLYESIAHATGQIIYEYNIDMDEIKVFGAAKEFLGVDLEELRIYSIDDWWKIIHPNDRKAREIALLRDRMKKGTVVSKYRMKNIDGDYVYVEDHCLYEKNQYGHWIQRGIIRDVNEEEKNKQLQTRNKELLAKLVDEKNKELAGAKKNLERQLQEAIKREDELKKTKEELLKAKSYVDQFFTMISDQLKSPTMSVSGFRGLLLENMDRITDKEVAGYLRLFLSSTDKIVNSLNLIILGAQLYSEEYVPHKKDVDVANDVLSDLCIEYESKAREKNLKFLFMRNVENTVAKTDAEVLKIGFEQIIDNAIKFTDSGEVHVIIERDSESRLTVKIKDTGRGIDEKFKDSLFKPFRQESHGYSRKFKGMGLGLLITKKYFELNNIELLVDSKLNEGTLVTVVINEN